jgi:hypothetical protein
MRNPTDLSRHHSVALLLVMASIILRTVSMPCVSMSAHCREPSFGESEYWYHKFVRVECEKSRIELDNLIKLIRKSSCRAPWCVSLALSGARRLIDIHSFI